MYTFADVDEVSSTKDALLQTIGEAGDISTLAQLEADAEIVPANAVEVPSSSLIVNRLVRATSDLYVMCTEYIFFTCNITFNLIYVNSTSRVVSYVCP